MSDKSPRQQMSQKSTKTLKEKRAAKRVSGGDATPETPVARKRNR